MLPILAWFRQFSTTTSLMTAAGLAIFVIALIAARNHFARARGVDKFLAFTNLCFAVPLALFGAEHFGQAQSMISMVPSYMPGRLFWVYLVGCALLAAALSIATNIEVRWSALLFGVMMLLFVAMLHLPGALRTAGRWTIVFRESSFGGGGLVLAGIAMASIRKGQGSALIHIGRTLIAITAIFFGVLHFLHPLAMPGVPLAKEMPTWVPARTAIDYVTGATLIAAGLCLLFAQKVRAAASYAGGWIIFLVAVIYVPVMISALADPSPAVQMEGLNYFGDTLLFGAVLLSPARAPSARDR